MILMKEFSHIGDQIEEKKRGDLLFRLGQRIKSLRHIRGLSPTDFGSEIGHTTAFVLRLENGEINASFVTLGRCAKALDFDLAEFLNV
jgi:transcriptional regulator with XRE-family HTH domain